MHYRLIHRLAVLAMIASVLCCARRACSAAPAAAGAKTATRGKAVGESLLQKPTPPPRLVGRVSPAAYEAEITGGENSAAKASPLPLARREQGASRQLSPTSSTTPSSAITSVVGSLVVVLGVFLAVVWLTKKFAPPGAAPLPKEAVELLGRAPLGGQHQMQLVRIGAKLLLVAVSPTGAANLTEITDAAEVERLTDLCRRQKSTSATAEFSRLLHQLGQEPTSANFVESSPRAAGRRS